MESFNGDWLCFSEKVILRPLDRTSWTLYILGQLGRKLLGILRDTGASVIIPVSDEKYVAGLADEIVYLKSYDLWKDDQPDENAIKIIE
jgi:hypothetical protein